MLHSRINKIRSDQNEGTRVLTTLYIHFFKLPRTANSVAGDGIWQKFKLIQAFMVVLVTCKNDEDPFQNESTRVITTFLLFKSIWRNFQTFKGS